MSFVVSARKYRPQQFKDVVGQKSVTTTLKNAIKGGKLAHSFLFCGPRGVGKTTCARILAKLLNCQSPTADNEPCGTCASCQAFAQSASFNIFELDAASNNSVDDIRNLIEQVRFAPQSGKYKIYIIDEVHMLSAAAFNAFLKTLEEPPSYAIFILATTEKHKIIPTILSRCQIYDFNRISVQDIVEHLQDIAKDQGIKADADALHIIAQKADGGLRDALSMFDRIASYSEGVISYQHVLEALNVLDYDYFFKATDCLLAQDAPGLLLMLDDILRKGFEGDNFINGLSAHFRNLLVCKDAATLPLLDVTEGLRERYRTQAAMAPMGLLLSALNIANECEIQYRSSKNKRLQAELALLKMCYAANAMQLPQTANGNTQGGSGSVSLMAGGGAALTVKPVIQQNTQEKKADPPPAVEKTETPPPPVNKLKEEKPPVYKTAGTVNINLDMLMSDKVVPETTKDEEAAAEKQDAAAGQNPVEQLPDEAAVLQCWQEYGRQLVNSGSVKTLFEQIIPKLKDHAVLLTITTEVQKELMKEDVPKFMGFLHSQTGNRRYYVEWLVNKTQADDALKNTPAYLPNEQLKEMLAINPKLSELIKRLHLQLNY
ncbi:DNA polymerase III subunit gamma/tau [Sphingobacteriales bacterium UPWRP_1]|nr:hypothetical protein BVG80_15450 [Sphingobacteriales bacterium TSM_CSM]PSJ79142.1 DNA polymerase III subunit gamma/tau [Sphingobacteriales bacterium UPWRP_1]